jgi:predicted porin
MEYNTEVHTLLLNADFEATDKLTFNGGIVYNWGKAEMDNLSATYFEGKEPATFGYDHAVAFSTIEDNTDLKIEETEYYIGCIYDFGESLSLNINASYTDYNDDDPYLYDTDGDLLLVNAGLTYRF